MGAFAERFDELRDRISCKRVVHFDLMSTHTDALYERLLREVEAAYTWDIQDENWAMGLCYTSGTQGEPRGVLYTHRSMFLHTLAVNQADVFGLTEMDCRSAGCADVPRYGMGFALRLYVRWC